MLASTRLRTADVEARDVNNRSIVTVTGFLFGLTLNFLFFLFDYNQSFLKTPIIPPPKKNDRKWTKSQLNEISRITSWVGITKWRLRVNSIVYSLQSSEILVSTINDVISDETCHDQLHHHRTSIHEQSQYKILGLVIFCNVVNVFVIFK